MVVEIKWMKGEVVSYENSDERSVKKVECKVINSRVEKLVHLNESRVDEDLWRKIKGSS